MRTRGHDVEWIRFGRVRKKESSSSRDSRPSVWGSVIDEDYIWSFQCEELAQVGLLRVCWDRRKVKGGNGESWVLVNVVVSQCLQRARLDSNLQV